LGIADTSNVGAAAQVHVLAAKSNQLRSAQPRLCGNQQQRSVTTPQIAALVWSCQQGIDFGTCQRIDRPSLVALAGNRQDPLRHGAQSGLFECHVLKKGVNGRQANVATPGSVIALLFQVSEKATNKRRIQVLDRQSRGRLMQMLLREFQEEPEGVSITGNRMGAGVALAHEAVGKKGLQ
jgi:hypothetical protein